MKRREFITVIGGAGAWPLVARAQPATLPTIGVLHPGSPAIGAYGIEPFRQGLNDAGFVDGRNINLEVHWLDGRYEGLPDLVTDMARRKVAAIFAVGIAIMRVAKAKAMSIPIVFSMGEDPVKEGIVASFNRPGGNITGFANFMNLLGSKRLTLLRGSVPKAIIFGILVNPNNPNAEPDANDWRSTANVLGREVRVFSATSERELEPAFAAVAQQRIGALFVNTDPLFIAWREQIVALAARYAVPTMYDRRDFPVVGGLMSYGANEVETIRSAGIYVGRILRGERPADLPVQQSTRFTFVINLRTARALNLEIPDTLLAVADEVIE
jgi:putative tryptophan/tyrosine transport system substrate-binding protein